VCKKKWGNIPSPIKKNGKKRKYRFNPKQEVLSNPGSIQLSLSQAKADPSIAWARLKKYFCCCPAMLA
jgi:hypothetical protein